MGHWLSAGRCDCIFPGTNSETTWQLPGRSKGYRMKLLLPMLLVPIAMFLACGSNPVTPDVQSLTQGGWTGTLFSDSTEVTFTVSGDTVKDFTVALHYDFAPQGKDTTVIWILDDFTVTNDSFSVFQEENLNQYTFSMDLTGGFTPPSNVSGTIMSVGLYQDSSSTDSVTIESTWQATP